MFVDNASTVGRMEPNISKDSVPDILVSKTMIEYLSGLLVLLMHLGFTLIEAGSVRTKHTASVFVRNLTSLIISILIYWILGYAFSFGSGHFFIGYSNFGLYHLQERDLSHWFLQATLASVPPVIVGGALAERCHLTGLLAYTAAMSSLIYPVVVHWAAAPEGWLYQHGFTDVGGAGCLHVVSGAAALVGACLIGRRDGLEKGNEGHSLPMAAIGGGLVIVGMVGKEVGLAVNSDDSVGVVGRAATSCLLAGAAGGLAHNTFCSMVGRNVAKVPHKKIVGGMVILLAHDDTHDEMAVGGFSNFARIFEENNLVSTGNKVFDDGEALKMLNGWKNQFPSILDLSRKFGCAPFTKVVLTLIEQNLFSVDSVLKYAKNPYNMRSVLVEHGFLKENTSLMRSFEPKRMRLDKNQVSDEMVTSSKLTLQERAFDVTPLGASIYSSRNSDSITFGSSSLSMIKNMKQVPSLDSDKLNKCFVNSDDDDMSQDDKALSQRARRKSDFFRNDAIKVEEEIIIDDTDTEDVKVDWKEKYEAVSSALQRVESELARKTNSLKDAETIIASLRKEKNDEKEEAEAKLAEVEERMNFKVAKLESELATISEINHEELGISEGDNVLVDKASFEQLLAKVSSIDAALSELPSKENLKAAVDYMDKSMVDKQKQMKSEIKKMMKASSDEILNKFN